MNASSSHSGRRPDPGGFYLTGDEDADRLLVDNPLALLIGMLLDQQVPMEWAFVGPHRLQERLGGALDADTVAETDPDRLEALFKEKPAIHRFPGSMAKRTLDLCRHVVEHHGGDAAAIWRDVDDAGELLARLKGLPGFGDQKAKIFLALLAKRFGVTPAGWQEVVGDYSDDTPRSIADVDSREALEAVREWKRAQKADR
jgi:uncharacterized HhH-GPD family protein